MADTKIEYKILEPEQVTEFMRELKTGERILSVTGDDNSEHIVILKKPTKQLETQGRIFYTALYNKLLQQGIPTRVAARKSFLSLLQENGVDPETFDKRRDEIHKKLAEQLSENMDEAKAKDVLTGVPELLNALNQNLKKLTPEEMALLNIIADNENLETQIMGNCAEAIAETEAQLFIMSKLAYNGEGKLIWPTPDSLEQETDLTFLVRLREEYQRFVSGFPLFFEVRLPNKDELPKEYPSL